MRNTRCHTGVTTPSYKTWAYETNNTVSRPAANIIETAQEYIVQLAAPSFTKEEFKITVEKNLLVVTAEQAPTEQALQYIYQEFKYGQFSRKFVLPEHTDKQQITAKYEQGILSVYVPKTTPTKVDIQIPVI